MVFNCKVFGRQTKSIPRKNQSQWMLKITEYADRLAADLDDVDFIIIAPVPYEVNT